MQDLAVLDAIALEMAEPEMAEPDEAGPSWPNLRRSSNRISPRPSPLSGLPLSPSPSNRRPRPRWRRNRKPKAPSSLGASLIASGIVVRPSSSHDALAPIRRMSQAERVAFFS